MMYLTPLLVLLLLSALLNFCLASKSKNIVHQQCERGSSSAMGGTSVQVLPTFDKHGNLDVSVIPAYAKFLEKNGIDGITLDVPRAGSTILSLSEKKKQMKAWCDIKRTSGFPGTVTCQVGAAPYNDVIELAKYAKEMCCDAVVAVAPLYFVPKDIHQLVIYLKGIAKACYPKPLLFADLKVPTADAIFNIAKLFGELVKNIKNFRGVRSIYHRCLEVKSVNHLHPDLVLISESRLSIADAYGSHLNGTTTLIANVFPEWVVKIRQAVLNGEYDTARDLQSKLNRIYSRCINLKNGPDRIDRTILGDVVQKIRLLIKIVNGLDLGKAPAPLPELPRDEVVRMYEVCREEGVAKWSPYDDKKDE